MPYKLILFYFQFVKDLCLSVYLRRTDEGYYDDSCPVHGHGGTGSHWSEGRRNERTWSKNWTSDDIGTGFTERPYSQAHHLSRSYTGLSNHILPNCCALVSESICIIVIVDLIGKVK